MKIHFLFESKGVFDFIADNNQSSNYTANVKKIIIVFCFEHRDLT